MITPHGILMKQEKRYMTVRKPEHYFRMFQGFGISITEVWLMQMHGVKDFIINYYTKQGRKIFRFNMEKITKMEIYDYKGDKQRIIPLSEMELIYEEEPNKRIEA